MRIDENSTKRYELTNLYLYPTLRCNLRCSHCYIASYDDERGDRLAQEVDVDTLVNVAERAKPLGLKFAKISGGEPFVRSDTLELCERLKDLDLSLCVESNGTLITEEIAKGLAKIKVGQVSVSIDGATPETHDHRRGREGSWHDAIRGAKRLIAEGINTQIIASLDRANLPEWQEIARLTEKIGARSCKFNIVMPSGRANDNPDILLTNDAVKELNESAFVMNDGMQVPLFVDLPIAFKGNKQLRVSTKKGCGVGRCPILNLLSVLDNGDISICGMGVHDETLYLGDARTDDLEEIWLRHPRLIDLRVSLTEKLSGVCGICYHRVLCLGACPAATYVNTGSFSQPNRFCQEEHDRGAFPTSRLIAHEVVCGGLED
jgi:SynChlorMet cassette radical SAM/SPASM protein ScmF